MNSRESQHEHFEELCALAALGQISPEEYRELQSHLRTCAACRVRQADFLEILHEHLPILDPQEASLPHGAKAALHDADYKQRFVQRARQQGIHFSDETLGKQPSQERVTTRWQGLAWIWAPKRLAYSLALLALGVCIGAVSRRTSELSPIDDRSAMEVVRLQAELARLNQTISELKPYAVALVPQVVENQHRSTRPADAPAVIGPNPLQKDLARARQDYALALARSQSLDEQLQKASAELAALKEELGAAKREGSQSASLRAIELALKQAGEELQQLQRERAVYASTFADQQAQIRELMEKVGTQTEILQQERDATATTRDIRELMGARNLHIIDVADVDSRGGQRPFGRVFYTEGKSLIFYAYDLEKRKKSLEKYSFQAWGQKEAKSGSAQSLGVFVTDDQAQNRWVLKYDDPKVLAQIDAVFVTIEPRGGSDRPQGQQLMYAYLKANPNHP